MKLRKVFKFIAYTLLLILSILILFIVYFFPGKSEVEKVEEIAFVLHRDAIIVEATLNDSGPYNFILDTGTDPSVVDVNLSDSISLFQISIGEQDVGEGKPLEIAIPLPMNLKVGNLPSSRKLFLGLALNEISNKIGFPIHGILGNNFIRDNLIQIDYQKQKLKIYPSGIDPYPSLSQNVRKLSLQFIDDGVFPLINTLSINGKRLNTTIDTGSNQPLTLYYASVDYLGLGERLKSARELETVGYGGAHIIKVVDSIDVKIDDWLIPNTEIHFDLSSEKSKVSLDIRGGNLGNKILKNFIVTFDYQNGIIWFEKI